MMYLAVPREWEVLKRILRSTLDKNGFVEMTEHGMHRACGVEYDHLGLRLCMDAALRMYGHRPDDTPRWNTEAELLEWMRNELTADHVIRRTDFATIAFYREKHMRVIRDEPSILQPITDPSAMVTVTMRTEWTFAR